jgi:hypothetical protein
MHNVFFFGFLQAIPDKETGHGARRIRPSPAGPPAGRETASSWWMKSQNPAIGQFGRLPLWHLPRIPDSRRLLLNLELRIGEATASLFSILVNHPK